MVEFRELWQITVRLTLETYNITKIKKKKGFSPFPHHGYPLLHLVAFPFTTATEQQFVLGNYVFSIVGFIIVSLKIYFFLVLL